MSSITLSLFGPPRLARDGVPIDLPSRKALALLAYLAITGTTHRRATLAALFWPESDARGARHALRSTLWLLRRTLDDAWLLVDRNTVALDGSQEQSVDVVRFRTLLAQRLTHDHAARDTCPACLPLLSEAVDLYGGHFLAGFTLRDSVEFDTWQSLETESLRQELVGALQRLVQGCTGQGQVEQAIECAKRWLALDPLDEAAHRALMRLYAGSGQQTAALRQFEACERVLMQELGISPGEETSELHQAIRERQSPQPYAPPPVLSAAPEILCPDCRAPNAQAASFCMRCGTKLSLVCPHCGAELPPDPHVRFCSVCGTQVSAPPPAPADAIPDHLHRLVPTHFGQRLLATRGQAPGERRIVTILLSDLQGPSSMADKLDPGEFMRIVSNAFDLLIKPITRYEGTVVRLMDDHILAFFGAPITHEDDAERACRAALDIITEAQQYAARLQERPDVADLSVRVAIHTGLVVVGEVGTDLRMEYIAMGDAVKVVSSVQAAAEPGSVLVTEDTRRLIAPLFETEALAPIKVRDRGEPVTVYRVLAPTELADKGRGIAGLASPLVGRDEEVQALREALDLLPESL